MQMNVFGLLSKTAVLLMLPVAVFGQSAAATEIVKPASYAAPVLADSPELRSDIEKIVAEVIAAAPEKNIKPDQLAVTVIDLRRPTVPTVADHRGDSRIYPASVVKMFYMVALERQLEDGKVTMTPELERGLKDMIVDSSNEATQYILDVLTDTSSGAEKPQKEFDAWQYKRNRVNRFFSSMGYMNINVNQKTFCEDAYGIEQQSRNYKGENRNMLTTNATARLMAEILLGRMNTLPRTRRMLDLMKRDPFAESKDPDSQAVGFSGKALIDRNIRGARLWSKAGWTSRTRHDVAYIETPDGLRFVVAVFTEGHANHRELIPGIVGKLIERMRTSK